MGCSNIKRSYKGNWYKLEFAEKPSWNWREPGLGQIIGESDAKKIEGRLGGKNCTKIEK